MKTNFSLILMALGLMLSSCNEKKHLNFEIGDCYSYRKGTTYKIVDIKSTQFESKAWVPGTTETVEVRGQKNTISVAGKWEESTTMHRLNSKSIEEVDCPDAGSDAASDESLEEELDDSTDSI